jgi:hypothetical protein
MDSARLTTRRAPRRILKRRGMDGHTLVRLVSCCSLRPRSAFDGALPMLFAPVNAAAASKAQLAAPTGLRPTEARAQTAQAQASGQLTRPTDSVQLSDSGSADAQEVRSEKIFAARARIADGSYDRPEVWDKVADGLLRDLSRM